MSFYSKFHLGKNQQSLQMTQDLQVLENTIRENSQKPCRYTLSPRAFPNWKKRIEMKSPVLSANIKQRLMTNIIELHNK